MPFYGLEEHLINFTSKLWVYIILHMISRWEYLNLTKSLAYKQQIWLS